MEEVRLMESRKSLRLMDQHGVVDSPASAVISPAVGASNAAKRCGALTTGIDVPGAYVGYVSATFRYSLDPSCVTPFSVEILIFFSSF